MIMNLHMLAAGRRCIVCDSRERHTRRIIGNIVQVVKLDDIRLGKRRRITRVLSPHLIHWRDGFFIRDVLVSYIADSLDSGEPALRADVPLPPGSSTCNSRANAVQRHLVAELSRLRSVYDCLRIGR